MRITALARGGLGVFGGSYDAAKNQAVIYTRDGETVLGVIEYPSAPTSPTTAEHGISSTDPAVSGNTVTFTLSSIQEGGYVDISATVGGAVRTVRILGLAQNVVDRYDCCAC